MSNELVRLEQTLQASSLSDLIRDETDYPMLLLDVSGSMFTLCQNRKTRLANLEEVVRQILAEGPLTMIAFGGAETSEPRFVDRVPAAGGGTPLHAAIRLAKEYGASRLVVISDGEPDLSEESMNAAREFGGRIDVCFVGDPGTFGEKFLEELARATGGERFTGDIAATKEIAGKVMLFLTGEVEERAPIVGEGFAVTESPDADDDEDDDDEDDDDEDDDDER